MNKNIHLGIALCASLLLLGLATTGFAAGYAHSIQSPNQKITFSWTVEGDRLAIKVSAKTKGWVGVGFNPSRMMKDANFIIGYVRDGKVKLTDQFGKTNFSHAEDTSAGGMRNVTPVGGEEKDGMTSLEYTIPLDSGDSHDRKLDIKGDTTLLLAYGAQDNLFMKHQYHTEMVVNLSTGEVK